MTNSWQERRSASFRLQPIQLHQLAKVLLALPSLAVFLPFPPTPEVLRLNHHCDKLVYTTDPQDAGQTDPNLSGIVEEFHAVPNVAVAPRATLRLRRTASPLDTLKCHRTHSGTFRCPWNLTSQDSVCVWPGQLASGATA